MKFALVTADPTHHNRFKIDCEYGDCTSFVNWIDVWGGEHLSFEALRNEDNAYLSEYDMVMMSGHPHYIQDIKRIGDSLRETEAVTMYYPEGSLQLYDGTANYFHFEYVEAWNACDIISSAEEDKLGYYRAFLRGETEAVFIHVPSCQRAMAGEFFKRRREKQAFAVVYSDNNPNHPAVAVACARRLGLPVVTVAVDDKRLGDLKIIFPDVKFHPYTKLAQAPFMRLLASSAIHFYPTEWIGTARENIACALAGTPCIGSRDSHTQRKLYPQDLAFNHWDVNGMVEAGRRLLADEWWYNKIAEEAFQRSRFYAAEETKKRFEDAVNTARERKRSRRRQEAAV